MKTKLNLEEIKLTSFVTTLEENQKATIAGEAGNVVEEAQIKANGHTTVFSTGIAGSFWIFCAPRLTGTQCPIHSAGTNCNGAAIRNDA